MDPGPEVPVRSLELVRAAAIRPDVAAPYRRRSLLILHFMVKRHVGVARLGEQLVELGDPGIDVGVVASTIDF